jgi:hypothetical protein
MSEKIQNAIACIFDQTSKGLKKKELIKQVRGKLPDTSKEQVKKGLKELEKSGKLSRVAGSKKIYVKTKSQKTSAAEGAGEKNQDPGDPLPIAEVLRRKQAAVKQAAAKSEKEVDAVDIDDEIRRLEAELEESDDDESSEYFSDENEEQDNSKEQSDGGGVLSLSQVAKDRIAPLPLHYLPTGKSKSLKVDRDQVEEPKKKRQKTKPSVSEGLRMAVKGVLDGYVARSNEKLPFYCRVCAKQHSEEREFFEHKRGAFHKAAVEMEKKASYCKLCRKQLTSPVQLKEHLNSKPHKEKLQWMKNRQQKSAQEGVR